MRRIVFSLPAIALFLAGCCTQHPAANPRQAYYGPTESMLAVVAAINSNNEKIPTLWSDLYYSATIHDRNQTHSVNGEGVLLYQQPADLRLVGQKEFVGTVFEVGSNDTEFWLEVVPQTATLWWGRYADLAHMDPDKLPIPIRPDLVLEVLGVGTINTDFAALPAPTMRFNNEQDAYIFIWNARAPDRWLAQKEIWYDRTTKRPRRVLLYDQNGRVVLRADLSMDKRVEIPDAKAQQGPLVAGDYKLFFPDSGSRMEFTLSDVRLYKTTGASPNLHIPNANSFHRPDVEGTDIRSIQIGNHAAQ